jgi:hypothetical protein
MLKTLKNLYCFRNSKILQALPNLIGNRCRQTKKIHPTNQLKYYQKKFQPDRPSRFGEKGGKPFSVTQKPILRKTRNIKKKFFSNFFDYELF